MIPLAETIGALCKMKSVGYARHIGVSNFTVPLLEEAVKLSPPSRWSPTRSSGIPISTRARWWRRRAGSAWRSPPTARSRAAAPPATRPSRRSARRIRRPPGRCRCASSSRKGAIVIPRTSKVERLTENMSIFDFELSDAEMDADPQAGAAERPDRRLGRRARMGLNGRCSSHSRVVMRALPSRASTSYGISGKERRGWPGQARP